jgi:DNA-directed RNA polymerase subunit RPC12/RpoP
MCRILVLLSFFAVVASSEARTWTDAQGRTVEAEFVRMHSGKVVLMRGNKPLTVPYDTLSPDDQEFVLQEMEKDGKGKSIPQEAYGRKWIDSKGKEIYARFVEVTEGGEVVLSRAGKQITIAFEKFSAADQAHIRLEAAKTGQASNLPAIANQPTPVQPMPVQPVPAQPPFNPLNPAAGGESPAQRFAREHRERIEQMNRDRQARDEQFRREQDARHQQAEAERQRREREQQERMAALETQRQQEQAQAAADLAAANAAAPAPSANSTPGPFPPTGPPVFSGSPGPMFQEVFMCSKCNKEVPANIKAGDKCPHCGIFFQTKEHADGTKEQASVGDSFKNDYRLWGKIIGLVLVIGIPLVIKAVKS